MNTGERITLETGAPHTPLPRSLHPLREHIERVGISIYGKSAIEVFHVTKSVSQREAGITLTSISSMPEGGTLTGVPNSSYLRRKSGSL